ncbi:hypothetical protein BKA69DRAFT_1104934 [Paraphysoderma sedebokerense]|nr:hypothetical protein BKA69DRAFT_1104934 [Paraphysoderma sedebokerense]
MSTCALDRIRRGNERLKYSRQLQIPRENRSIQRNIYLILRILYRSKNTKNSIQTDDPFTTTSAVKVLQIHLYHCSIIKF